MGKERKSRMAKKKRKNKFASPREAVRENGDSSSGMVPRPFQTALQTLLQQVQMPNMEEKLCGLQTLGTLLESSENIGFLIEQNVARAVAPLLLDENSLVRNTAAGTLRNFSTVSIKACEHLVEQDVMTLLIAFFQRYAENWIPKKVKSGNLDEDGDAFLQAINLMRNLCECSDTSLKRMDNASLLPIFIRCLDRETFGDEVVISVLQMLLVIMEDNLKTTSEVKIMAGDVVKGFMRVDGNNSAERHMKILAIGIFLIMEQVSVLPDSALSELMGILSTMLSIDLRDSYNRISSMLPLVDGSTTTDSKGNDVEIQKDVKILKDSVDTVQLAIEILTNMCNTIDDDEDMEVDEGSNEDDEVDDNIKDDCVDNSNGEQVVTNIPDNVCNAMKAASILEKVCKVSVPLPENVMQILKDSDAGRDLLQRYYAVQSRSLLCMNNLIENISIADLEGLEGIYRLWTELGKLIFKINLENEEILEAATTAMRAALDRFKREANNIETHLMFKDLSRDDIQTITNGIVQSECPEFRANLSRMIGDLGLIIQSKDGIPSDIEILIATFLLERMLKETEFWVVAEIIDTIMDLFSEDVSDLLAAKTGLIEHLSNIGPAVRIKIRQQRKSLGDHYPVAYTVATNLPRFIRYKRKRVELLKLNKK